MSKRTFQEEFTETSMSNQEIINKRRVINGYDDGLLQASPLKHPWARDIFKNMQKNNWVAEEISFQKDKEQWEGNELTEREKECFSRALAFASNLDGLLVNSLSSFLIQLKSSAPGAFSHCPFLAVVSSAGTDQQDSNPRKWSIRTQS